MEVRSQTGGKVAQTVPGQGSTPGVKGLPKVAAEEPARRSAYGLPCAKCGMYYEAALTACPICKSSERVSPRTGVPSAGVQTSPTQSLPVAAGALEGIPDAAALDEERDRFLRELKAQLYQAPVKLQGGEVVACARESAHADAPVAAEICRDCYDQAQESADRIEAALHMDLTEAGKIVYEAVWADTSDPDKTYVNAAQALLNAVRSRAGISSIPSAPHKYSH